MINSWFDLQVQRFLLGLFVVALSAGSISSAWSDEKSYLRVESGAHTAVISDLMVTSDGKYVVSAADDKTIRVWDTDTYKESRKILGYIGRGHNGAIHATALSADDRHLAVAVHRGENRDKRGSGDDAKDVIRLYDFASGELLKVLQPHNSDDVISVSFSEDGAYMVSGSEDHSIHVWDMSTVLSANDPEPAFTIREPDYIRRPWDISIFKHGDDYRVLAADYNESQAWVSLYSLNQKKILNAYKDEDRLLFVAVSDRYIAVCGYQHHVLVFDRDLNKVRQLPTPGRPASLAFSPDGKLLLVGAKETTRNDPIIANIYDVEDDFKIIPAYQKKYDAEVRAVAFLDNHTAITGGGSANEIHFWNARSGELENSITGAGGTVFAVGIKDRKVAFGRTQTFKLDQNNYAPLEHVFDFSELEAHIDVTPETLANYVRANPKQAGQTLVIDPQDAWNLHIHTGADDYDYPVFRNSWYFHEAFGFTDAGLIASAGRSSEVRLYQRDPGARWATQKVDLIGHTSRVWDLATEKNWLVTGSVDQTIKIWNLDSASAGDATSGPMLNLFVASDGEWIVWSESGYYDASIRGDRYIGYHVNQGEDAAALFYTSDRFLKTLYRPDIIQLILETGSEAQALQTAELTTNQINEILPPTIQLHSAANLTTAASKATLEFSVAPERDPVTGIWILNNGKLAWSSDADTDATAGRHSATLELLPGNNTLEVFAESKVARSSATRVTITVDDSEWQARGRFEEQEEVQLVEEKPNLYVLAIGVSEYENTGRDLNNLNYAHKDAIELEKAFQSQAGRTYNEVISRVIVNQNATRDAIEQGFQWLQDQALQRDAYKRENHISSDDISLVFLAGHGLKRGEDFFFLGHDADVQSLETTAVKLMQQGDILSSLPTEVVLMTDACHAGTIGGGLFENLDTRELSKRLVALNERAIYIINATKSDKPSLESSSMGHGVFTLVMLEGLEHDTEVYIQPFISFVKRNVKKRTQGAPSGPQEPHVVHYGEYEDYLIHSN